MKDTTPLVLSNDYDKKYGLIEKEMFIIKGMEKVREVIAKIESVKRRSKERYPIIPS